MISFRQYLTEEKKSGATIYVLRHARTSLDDEGVSDGWLDFPLSDEGRQGLVRPVHFLKNEEIHKIYAPSLRRTHETATILKSGILSNPEVCLDDQSRTWHLGTMMGEKKKVTRPMVQMFMENPDMVPPKGESMNQFKNRFHPWLEERKEEASKHGPLVLVMSGSNIREISNMHTGEPRALDLSEAGMIKLHHDGSKWNAHVLFGSKDENDENIS